MMVGFVHTPGFVRAVEVVGGCGRTVAHEVPARSLRWSDASWLCGGVLRGVGSRLGGVVLDGGRRRGARAARTIPAVRHAATRVDHCCRGQYRGEVDGGVVPSGLGDRVGHGVPPDSGMLS